MIEPAPATNKILLAIADLAGVAGDRWLLLEWLAVTLDSDEDDDDSKKGNNSSNTDGAAHWLDAALGIQPGDQEVEEDHKDQDEEDDPNNDIEDEDQLTPHQHTPATASTTSQASHETTQD